MEQKKTKIICTISDMNCETEFISQLYQNGMNVARINSAHATIEGAQKVVDNIRAVSDKIGILIDTKGPEVRLTGMENSVGFLAKAGDRIMVCNGPRLSCNSKVLYTTCPTFVEDVPVGARILIDDGSVELLVTDKSENALLCNVQNDGVIKGKKSVNVPNVHISLPALTDKDKIFVNWAIEANIDFIAHSFVRNKEDLMELQSILDEKKSHLKIISKIENSQGVENIDDILTHCYGVMIARGDLGVEIAAEKIPLIQKKLIEKCRSRKKPVIVATQMLHSMIENPRPTRAEVSDVANAILQSTDAIMLSGETASGKYPVEAVKTMSKIAERAEKDINYNKLLRKIHEDGKEDITGAISHATCTIASDLNASAIITVTISGFTAEKVSRFKPSCPIICCSVNPRVCRQAALLWGVTPLLIEKKNTTEDLFKEALWAAEKVGMIKKGERVVVTAGVPLGVSGNTNMIRVVEV